jgi:hypothetical protein
MPTERIILEPLKCRIPTQASLLAGYEFGPDSGIMTEGAKMRHVQAVIDMRDREQAKEFLRKLDRQMRGPY